MTNYSLITLGELLSSENETIKRNAVSILKEIYRTTAKENKTCYSCGQVYDIFGRCKCCNKDAF